MFAAVYQKYNVFVDNSASLEHSYYAFHSIWTNVANQLHSSVAKCSVNIENSHILELISGFEGKQSKTCWQILIIFDKYSNKYLDFNRSYVKSSAPD